MNSFIFEMQKCEVLMSSLSVFSIIVLLVLYLKNHCLTLSPEDLLMFSSEDFIILALKFRSIIHFGLLFMDGVR